MNEPGRPSETNGLTVSGWGATIRVVGRDVLIVVTLLLLAGQMTLDRRDRMSEHATLAAASRDLARASRDLACMLAIPTEPSAGRLDATADPQGACHYISTIYRFAPGGEGRR